MIRFYVWERGVDPLPSAPELRGLSVEVWRPSGWNVRPAGMPVLPYAIWSAFHHFRVFSNGGYGVVILRNGRQVAHSSLVTPRYARFPEMGTNDVQIGATYTAPEWRGKGLAKAAVRVACDQWSGEFERVWYLVGDENLPSIRVIEACGFRVAGTGERVRRFGVGLLGQYRILSRAGSR